MARTLAAGAVFVGLAIGCKLDGVPWRDDLGIQSIRFRHAQAGIRKLGLFDALGVDGFCVNAQPLGQIDAGQNDQLLEGAVFATVSRGFAVRAPDRLLTQVEPTVQLDDREIDYDGTMVRRPPGELVGTGW